MPNSTDIYKRIFLLAVPFRIIVPWFYLTCTKHIIKNVILSNEDLITDFFLVKNFITEVLLKKKIRTSTKILLYHN